MNSRHLVDAELLTALDQVVPQPLTAERLPEARAEMVVIAAQMAAMLPVSPTST
jgi:hypothetical protein